MTRPLQSRITWRRVLSAALATAPLLLGPVPARAAVPALPQLLEGRVVSVADGDTLTLLDSNNLQHKVRLAGIDAPEKGQAFGEKSRQSLARAVHGKDVRIEWSKRDHYGRFVAKVWARPPDLTCMQPPCPKTLDVNLAQLTVGLAWHYKEYEREQSEEDRHRYAFAEQEARARKAGLWSEPDPVPPWAWRRGLTDGPVKKSRNDICHEPGSRSYRSVKQFTSYASLDACLASGGRLPKPPGS
jgi:endonuclease YncB( thermonuclease family)